MFLLLVDNPAHGFHQRYARFGGDNVSAIEVLELFVLNIGIIGSSGYWNNFTSIYNKLKDKWFGSTIDKTINNVSIFSNLDQTRTESSIGNVNGGSIPSHSNIMYHIDMSSVVIEPKYGSIKGNNTSINRNDDSFTIQSNQNINIKTTNTKNIDITNQKFEKNIGRNNIINVTNDLNENITGYLNKNVIGEINETFKNNFNTNITGNMKTTIDKNFYNNINTNYNINIKQDLNETILLKSQYNINSNYDEISTNNYKRIQALDKVILNNDSLIYENNTTFIRKLYKKNKS